MSHCSEKQNQLLAQGFEQAEQSKGFSDHIGPFFQRINEETDINDQNTKAYYRRAIVIEPHHLNPEGVVHGGLTLSFMDYLCYRAIGDEVGHDIQFATINLNSNFLAAAKMGNILYGEGVVVRKTRSVVFAEGLIFTPERKIMTASGIWKIIGS